MRKISTSFRCFAALALLGAAGVASAASVDQLEIDFTFGTPVPLSPWLAAIVAVALGLAALALLKRHGTPRMLLLGAAAIVAFGVFALPQATPANPGLSLTSSPTLMQVSCATNPDTFFFNATGKAITLTRVAINSGGSLGSSLNGGSCHAGATLAPNAGCDVVIALPGTCQQGT
jgi:ABC-type branched-subunit amino acid transport system permease subunit